ncbi:trna ligase [Coemansia sp. RSA 1813]|nr:tRNA ligase [Coemansia sp. RSA 1646]KAJ1772291.1 trna ligase [Coemansia sp. RSA 1843]KAJ2093233.1 trna ligase [Coemansia sp. RSA 986]KAJ2217502.1 trna ligase [Coemansia sp. RSA 487]KAJ2573485.1 trna ligase [Coemansia sp. RSA 1813]
MKDSVVFGSATVKEKLQNRKMLAAMRTFGIGKSALKKMLRNTKYIHDGHSLTSWKCADHLYKSDPCPLPTLARGLFTSGDSGEEKIVIRGYDKFFNVNEIPKTNWSTLTSDTRGPYEMTVKEDGCLILAAALDDGKKLLVTSKHGVNLPHSDTGMKWMRQHLSLVNKTTEDFAEFLHENNATAAFELCDDEFEEHILEYPERMRGLYLHGLNRNTVQLVTWASSDVTKVAEEFGFLATKYFVFDSIEEGKELADKVRKDQALDGRAIEGFVMRCRTIKDSQPFMFKIKYDEPYLLFYEWQQTTNRILSGTPYKTTFPLTKLYATWVKEQVKTHPEDFAEYNMQKGVIGARKRFLAYYQAQGGSEAMVFVQASGSKKTLIMPIATAGCGKTTISLVLSKLFGFGHVQSDNITTKKSPRDVFHRVVLNEFDSHNFVIADRSNHIPELRKSLRDSVWEELPGCRVIALYWDHERALQGEILNKTTNRVINRGKSHQSLTPDRNPDFRRIMRGLVASFTPIDQESEKDATFDAVVDLDPLADSSVNVRAIINNLCDMFSDELKRPSEKEIDDALDEAFKFSPTLCKPAGKLLKQAKLPSYIALAPRTVNMAKWLAQQIKERADVDWRVCKELREKGQMCFTNHIMLVRLESTEDSRKKEIFNEYIEALGDAMGNAINAGCKADYIVCNDEIMALRVKTMVVNGETKLSDAITRTKQSDDSEIGNRTEFISINAIPYITLCVGPNANPGQAEAMLETVFGSENADIPKTRPDGWAVIPVTLRFGAVLQKFRN